MFDAVADQSNEPSYNASMIRSEKLTDGAIDVGTRFRATVTHRGRPVEIVIEYTGFDRPHRIASVTRMAGADVCGAVTFDPHPDGTLMRWSWRLTPKGALKLLRPIFGLVGRRQERRIWTGLKQELEAADTEGVGSS